jgi:hypothetical protein
MALHTNSIAGSLKLLGLVSVLTQRVRPASPRSVSGLVPRFPRRPPIPDSRGWMPFGRSRAYGELSTTSNATLAGQQENCWVCAWRRPDCDFTIAGEGQWAGG